MKEQEQQILELRDQLEGASLQVRHVTENSREVQFV